MLIESTICARCHALVLPETAGCRCCDPVPEPAARDDGADPAPIPVTARHFARIEHLAHIELDRDHAARRLLIEKLARARLCLPAEMPRDVVTVNARVLFALDDLASRSCFLVYPDGFYPTGQYVSLGSPLGAALLGARAGHTVTFADHQGAARRLRVDKVIYQPEAHDAIGR